MRSLPVSSDHPSRTPQTRRDFLKTSAAMAAASSVPFWFATGTDQAAAFASPSERPVVGCIGTGSQWSGYDGPRAMQFFDCVAVCDVDSEHAAKGLEKVKKLQPNKGKNVKVAVEGDYRKVLDRKDVDVVTIVTPDHWHTKIAIEAMQAGKDVYCEKPLTLTIDEGKQIIKVLENTKPRLSSRHATAQRDASQLPEGRRHDQGRPHRTRETGHLRHRRFTHEPSARPRAAAREPQLGHVARPDSQGRLHGEASRQGTRVALPLRVPLVVRVLGGQADGLGPPTTSISPNGRSAWTTRARRRSSRCTSNFPSHSRTDIRPSTTATTRPSNSSFAACSRTGRRILIVDKSPGGNGVTFEGTKGSFHVGRSLESFNGEPVDELKTRPLPGGLITKLYKGKKPGHHMGNFAECVKTREQPVSDVYTHHRAITTCHLANISMRLGRSLTWDPQAQQIVGDKEAQKWQSREQRKGYEINV